MRGRPATSYPEKGRDGPASDRLIDLGRVCRCGLKALIALKSQAKPGFASRRCDDAAAIADPDAAKTLGKTVRQRAVAGQAQPQTQ